jgi:aspartate racemase
VKTIGLIGGIGWPSSMEYYRILNQKVAKLRGHGYSAKICLISLDQNEFVTLAAKEDKKEIKNFLVNTFRQLSACGAEVAGICANGAHRFKSLFISELTLNFVDLIEVTARHIAKNQLRKVGLIGVKETMQGSFYQEALAKHSIECIVPPEVEQKEVHSIIYAELLENRLSDLGREKLINIMEGLRSDGAEGIILGCTELPMFLKPADSKVPLFSTTEIHCDALIEAALKKRDK